MKIWMIRHGEPDYERDCLTPKGREEAELFSRWFRRQQVKDIYVSPLRRARQTAEYSLRATGREAEELLWLQEFRARHLDPLTGEMRILWDRMPRLLAQYPGAADPENWPDIPLFAGSDAREVWEETKAGVDALLARYGFRKEGPVWKAENNRPDTIALFCHFGLSMAVLGYLTGVSPMIYWHHAMCLPTSLTEVVTEERVKGEVIFRAARIGDLSHLTLAGEPASTHGLFPEVYTGVDSTNPMINGTLPGLP